MAENDVFDARLHVDISNGCLYAEYPPGYGGTTFSIGNSSPNVGDLLASTSDEYDAPTLILFGGYVYAFTVEKATFDAYIRALQSGRYKVSAKLEFLQPDNSVAFVLGNKVKRGYQKDRDTRAFLQDGSLNVSLQNGIRRKATVKLANADEAFEYNVNKIWYGRLVRLLMGIELPDGTEILFPQGVFTIENPQAAINPSERTITYQLVDKWADLNGEHGGTFDTTYIIPIQTADVRTNIFNAMQSLLRLSRKSFEYDGDTENMIDGVTPVFTDYYNGKTYYDAENNTYVNVTDLPYEVAIDSLNGNVADALLELNAALGGLIGYDANGALRVEPSQDDISDADKPVLWSFSTENALLSAMPYSAKNTEVKNDVIISSANLDEQEIWGRASNYDPQSDTNINMIGRKTYRETNSAYWNAEQCASLAQYELKKRTMLQKSVSVECAPIFHLQENGVIEIRRYDKEHSPVEKHLITSYTLPISETGTMQINATAINDIPNFTITTAVSAS